LETQQTQHIVLYRVDSAHSLHDIVRTLREAHNAPLGKLLLKLGDCERDERFILQMTQLWIVQAQLFETLG
jgi:hypothetical protein